MSSDVSSGWRRRSGDRVIRRPRIRGYRLRRVLGVPALYSAGYGNVGSSIYYALGIVAVAAMGATPIVLGIAGVFFVFTALTYAEGAAMLPEAGGSATFARRGFNDTAGFIAGWALVLTYMVTIAISAYTIPSYLGYFWAPLKESPFIGTATAMGLVLFLMAINVIGIRETSLVNVSAAVLDLATQVALVAVGFITLFDPSLLAQRMVTFWPSISGLVFGVAIAALAYTGVETVAQMAEEARHPSLQVPQSLILMTVTVLVLFAGISMVAMSAMSPSELASQWAKDPVAGIANSLPVPWLRDLFRPLVAVLAATILLIATNAGLIGISRLCFSLGSYRLLPSTFSRVHHRFKTPYVSIIVFTTVALVILMPGLFSHGFFVKLGALYVFGSLLANALAHASILRLRMVRPDLPRPFKLGLNVRFRGYELPVTAILGLIAMLAIWLVILVVQDYSRWVGLGWMALGLLFFKFYRRRRETPAPHPSPAAPLLR